MATNAVSSVTSAQAQAPQQVRAKKSEADQSSAEAAKARESEQQAKKTEQPKPVVNAEGQTTGRVVNETA